MDPAHWTAHTTSDWRLAVINVPDHVSRTTIRRFELPRLAGGPPDFSQTRAIGDKWASAGETCMLVVPSRIAPDRFVYIINPRHTDFEDIEVVSIGAITEAPDAVAKTIDKRQVFLCHASEDKESVVRPVKEALFLRGINSWIDEAEITLGDSITHKVNKGLGDAEYVIVFISPAFIRKTWARRELDAALNREARTGKKVVIPIVIHYETERVDYAAFLPLAEDKVYGIWDGNAGKLATQIERAIRQGDA